LQSIIITTSDSLSGQLEVYKDNPDPRIPLGMLSRFATPLYKNTGSVARDHLASERTFLAWMRTGLGFVALGIAIERFSQLDLTDILRPLPSPSPQHPATASTTAIAQQHQTVGRRAREDHDDDDERARRKQDKLNSQTLVAVLMGLGAGSILYGTVRYFSNLRLLERGYFKPAFHGTAVMATSVAGLAGGVFASARARRTEEREQEL
jgi:uncharacterized membrane protein YidH (DUF202 family)